MPRAKKTDTPVSEPEQIAKPTSSLRTQAEGIVKQYRITFGSFKGKRIIYNDHGAPREALDTLAKAMRKGLI